MSHTEVSSRIITEIEGGFHKRHALNVADYSTQFNDAHLRRSRAFDRLFSNPPDPLLQVLAHELLLDDHFIDFAGGHVVV